MLKIISVFLLVGFCFAQDSTDVERKLGEVAEMRIEAQFEALIKLRLEVQNTIIMAQSQIAISQEDISRIDYAEFILKKLFDPLEQKTDSIMMPHEPPKVEDVQTDNDNIMNENN